MVKQTTRAGRNADLDSLFGALSDTTRRAIIERLADGRRAAVTEIAGDFAISLPAVSRHLKVLERCGMLRRERQGRTHYLSLDVRALDVSALWIESARGFWETRLDALSGLMSRRKRMAERVRGAT